MSDEPRVIDHPTDAAPDAHPLASGEGRQIMPGWYLIDQRAIFETTPWTDAGRLHVEVSGLTGARIETFYLNLDAAASGGGLPGEESPSASLPRRKFELPGSPGRAVDGMRFRKYLLPNGANGVWAPPPWRHSKIVCSCAAPVTVTP